MSAKGVIMYQVKFNIRSYWRAGTGRGGGTLLDEEVHKDVYGLPCLPGRTVKGLLRRAVYRAEKWGLLNKNGGDAETAYLTQCWFGSAENRLENEAGAFSVSDAVLDKELRDYLISLLTSRAEKPIGESLRQGFFHQIYATAIEHKTGSAKDKSLRGMEVTIPLTLTAQLSVHPDKITPKWFAELAKCLPLIRAVGTSCSRGLGRVTVTLE
ncbi:MAG: hypothetical protein DRR19_10135 [Candidatus Parabeggiatoa sp. nov. 1]|nr:MAG: hypothetical protein DRR19_10135 [Gammaproteobacteria bacterium]